MPEKLAGVCLCACGIRREYDATVVDAHLEARRGLVIGIAQRILLCDVTGNH